MFFNRSAAIDAAAIPSSGRLLARQLGAGQEILLGVLHFAPHFVPREGALYLMTTALGQVRVLLGMLDADMPLEAQGGVTGTLKSACWRGTTCPGALTVRFIEAFPESNGWTVYGPCEHALFPPQSYEGGHAFLSVQDGTLSSLPLPEGLSGAAAGQILNDMPLWPDANGTLHAVPSTEARWRSVYFDWSMLQARLGAGEISEEELREEYRKNPQFQNVASPRPDIEYCRYLTALRDAGGIISACPLTAEALAARAGLALQIVSGLYVERKRVELTDLAIALGIDVAPCTAA